MTKVLVNNISSLFRVVACKIASIHFFYLYYDYFLRKKLRILAYSCKIGIRYSFWFLYF